jgi:PKD repeat protein
MRHIKVYILSGFFCLQAMVPLLAQGYITSHKPNFDFLSKAPVAKHSEELNKYTAQEFKDHPDFAIKPFNAPCENCFELIDKRTEYSRYYLEEGKQGKTFFQQQGYSPIHYKDSRGDWRVIDYRLKKTSRSDVYVSENTSFHLSINADSGYVSINNKVIFNHKLEALIATGEHEVTLGYARWENYSAGDDGIRVIDAWDGIDIEITVLGDKIKTNFVMKKKNTWGNTFIIRDHMVLPDGYTLSNIKTNKPFAEDFVITNEEGKDVLNFDKAYGWDSAENANTEVFNYVFKGNNALDIEIPISWLTDASRIYPVIIDPLVTNLNTLPQASITGSGYNATCSSLSTGCLYNLAVAVPPNCTVTDVLFNFDYITTGLCVKSDGGYNFKLGTCRSPNNSYWRCSQASPGQCLGTNISIFNDLVSCIGPPQCTSYNLNFVLDFFRCASPSGGGCSANCIAAASPWTTTIVGRTVETASLLGNGVLNPVVCQGQLVNLTAQGQFGVPPYSYSWNSGAFTGASVNANPTTTTNYTVVITDACGQTVSQSILVNVVNTSNPGFTLIPQTLCPGESVTIIGSGNGINTSYDWQMTGANPSFINDAKITSVSYAASGVYNVVLNYTENGCTIPLTQQVTVNAVTTPSVSILVSPTLPVCSNTPLTFSANIVNGGSNPIYNWTVNGLTVSNAVTFTTSTYSNNDIVALVVTSSTNCSQAATVNSNTIVIQTTLAVAPTVSITASPSNQICAGNLATFTATATNAGTAPVYQWKVNGANVGSNSPTYSSSSLANGNVITVTLTSNDPCASPAIVNAAAITMTVNPNLTPTVSIAASPSNTICTGTPTTFTASATNAGTAPVYQWKVNGANVGSNSSTYSSSALANGDVIAVTLSSNAACANPATANATAITMVVNPSLTPTVSIAATPSNTICTGTPTTFTASATNAGIAPVYQWKVNGVNVGSNSPTYSSSALANGDVIAVTLSSNALCANPATVNATAITMVVNATQTPTVSIAASPSNAICAGTPTTFTATATNAGTAPVYQWKVNGLNVGSNSTTYSSSSLANGDLITVTLTSNDPCANPAIVNATAITMTVSASQTPTVSIAASPSNTICAGTSTTFTATATNAGTAPVYQWKINGINVGSNSPTYSSSALANGDVITLTLSSNAACANPTTANATAITMTVNPSLSPTVSSTASPSNTICAGTPTTITATATNAGTAPVYQWKVNGVNVGSNSTSYSSSSFANGDVIAVTLTSNALCANPATVNATAITMVVNASQTPTVSIAASPSNAICTGTPTTFTASATNTGTAPVYQWKVNGLNTGSNSPTYSSSSFANGDVITVTLTSNALCANPNSTVSNSVIMGVSTSQTPSVSITTSPSTTLCAGAIATFTANAVNAGLAPTYQWYINGNPVGTNTATFLSSSLSDADVVTVSLTSNAPCVSPQSALSSPVNISVIPVLTPTVSLSVNPGGTQCEGTPLQFTATPTNGGLTPGYQWFVNNLPVGNNSPTYTSASLQDGDVVEVELISSEQCPLPQSVRSPGVVLDLISTVSPSITLTPSQNLPVCDSTALTFTADTLGGGIAPSIQWYLNGALQLGATGNSFNHVSVNGDIVSVTLTTSAACATSDSVSNQLTVQTIPYLIPSITISSNPPSSICSGQTVTYTAVASDAGINPTIQWYLNGSLVGTNSTSYSSNTIIPGDTIEARVTSAYSCITQSTAISNPIALSVNPPITVAITPSADTLCEGSKTQLVATASGGSGAGYTYVWNNGTTGNAISVTPTVSTTYSVSVTESCAGTPGTASATLTIIASPLANFSFSPQDNITTLDAVFFTNKTQFASWWTWDFGDGTALLDTAQNPVHRFDSSGIYSISLQAVNEFGCTDTLRIAATVKKQAIYYVPNAFTPNIDGLNEVFKVYSTDINSISLFIYARNGELVYDSETDSPPPSEPFWTGQKHNQGNVLPCGVYVYCLVVNSTDISLDKTYLRGVVTLVR